MGAMLGESSYCSGLLHVYRKFSDGKYYRCLCGKTTYSTPTTDTTLLEGENNDE